jgi:hypothetical protein
MAAPVNCPDVAGFKKIHYLALVPGERLAEDD